MRNLCRVFLKAIVLSSGCTTCGGSLLSSNGQPSGLKIILLISNEVGFFRVLWRTTWVPSGRFAADKRPVHRTREAGRPAMDLTGTVLSCGNSARGPLHMRSLVPVSYDVTLQQWTAQMAGRHSHGQSVLQSRDACEKRTHFQPSVSLTHIAWTCRNAHRTSTWRQRRVYYVICFKTSHVHRVLTATVILRYESSTAV